jgi:3' exoribonuclease, RNase T-like
MQRRGHRRETPEQASDAASSSREICYHQASRPLADLVRLFPDLFARNITNIMNEIYVSTDVEADGPIPGPHSMLSFGSAAFTADGRLLSTFSANLELLEGAVGHPDTMAWWQKNNAAWEKTRTELQPPAKAMQNYLSWLKNLPGKPVFVGYPAAYDFMFVYWYLIRFAGESPFSHSALDIKTFAMAMLGLPYRESTKRNMPKRWFPRDKHTHVGLDDAIEQGRLFCNMLAEHGSGEAKT